MDHDLIQIGLEGRVDFIPKRSKVKVDDVELPLNTLPLGLPPVLPSLEEDLQELLCHPEKLPIHDTDRVQRFIPRESDPESLYSIDVTPLQTTIVVDRNPTTGELLGFKEEFLPDTGASTRNSTSLKRPPGPPSESVRGSSINAPFWPGGLDEPNIESLKGEAQQTDIDLEKDLLTIPPGFSKGVTFEKKSLANVLDLASKPTVLNLADILAQGDCFDLEDEEEEEAEKDKSKAGEDKIEEVPQIDESTKEAIDHVIKLDERVELPWETQSTTNQPQESWAIKVDISSPVDDFHKRIPDMAYKWPFEPDVFQKQAILHLESHDNVFVAAHTSAGKTVVAEYAIALSLKHMTRTIYTSPIKALSNQKFRDFKTTFKDVGLITGDVQINPQGACLIMTTEILRSMLYNGSDVIRDLEWVIFDEVHYINDAERGVVWEEVLIMLPQHVNIILLSATVPNTIEFAEWIGRTKKRKMYVVSTQKRPVPLEHFLYTGTTVKTNSEQLFMILDAGKNFLTNGYNKALEVKKDKPNKPGQAAKGQRSSSTAQQDKNVWLSVIDMLKRKNKLPVVAFTFSKKRIDENANHLSSVDLLVASEKSEVHVFFHKCISKLRGTDKQLPQVLHMEELLKRGIGVHHSGVLPILKEVVEMLFHKGLVKILFATETFAMGVNMPARTVVFDSIRKHDGKCFRDLLPGEYIQMAGRAGRRGLDTTGTVIILCKADVPEMADLHKMMMGRPTLLQSQFRLTYTMILNLLRVEQLRVEDMMKRSFSEFHNQKDVTRHKDELQDLLKEVGETEEVVDYSGDLEQYYRACEEYQQLKERLQAIIMTHPQAIKSLTPGRIVIVDTPNHPYSLGVTLQTGPASSKERTFSVLVLCEQKNAQDYGKLFERSENKDKKKDEIKEDPQSQSPKPYAPRPLYRPEGPSGHKMIKVLANDIAVITLKTIKITPEKIMDDIRKREQPRFKKDPPGQSTSVATQELLRLTESNPSGLPGLDPLKDLHLRDMELVEDFRRLAILEGDFKNYVCVQDPTFEENFKQLRSNMKLKDRYNNLKFLLSDQSLQLLPEYQQRIDVLRRLQYIDDTSTVQLKGRVACEISSHELIITELVFDNVLTDLHPTEIASVLSCVVFEQKRCSEPELVDVLKKAKESFLSVAMRIGLLQRECGLPIPADDYVEQFHFGLMEVVYEWARGMPFSEITGLTDIQEGIIVRCIQRLDETLKDVRNAARIIGDPILYQKMEEASGLIKRDIVFAASLYTQ